MQPTFTPSVSTSRFTQNNKLVTASKVKSRVILFLLPFFLLTAFFLQAQTIGVPTVGNTPVCAGGTVNLSFVVTNGNTVAKYFTTSTTYLVYITNATGTGYTMKASFTSGSSPAAANGATATINYTFTIPTATTNGSGFKISIGATTPTVSGSAGTNASAPFTVYATPTTANAGVAKSVCNGSSVAMTANTPVIGTGSWSIVSGPSTSTAQFSSTTSPTASFTAAGGAGVYQLKWTISNGTCNTSNSTVNVTVAGSPTTANAGSAQSVCIGRTATLAANTPTTGTGLWSIVSGPSVALTQFSSTSNPAAVFTPSKTGTYILKWTISNSPCTASTSNVTITVNAAPTTSRAGSPQTICSNASATLAANVPLIGTGAWTVQSGPSTAANQFSNTAANNAVFSPAGGGGTYTLAWTISNNGCTASVSTVAITAKAASASTTNVSVCSYNLPYTWNGTTYNSSGTYVKHFTNAIGCDSAATLDLTVLAVPSLGPISGNASTCLGTSTTFSNSTPGGTWSSNNTSIATVNNSGVVSGVAAGSATISYTYSNGTCQNSVTKNITVNDTLTIHLNDITNVLCKGTSTGSISLYASGGSGSGYTYSIDNGATYQSTGDFNNLAAGNYTILIKDPAACGTSYPFSITEPSNGISIHFSAAPIPCIGQSTLVSVTATGGLAPYSGTGNIPQFSGTAQYTVSDNNGCSVTDSFTLADPLPFPAPDTIRGPLNVCEYIGRNDTATYSVTLMPGASGYSWTIPAGATIVSARTDTNFIKVLYDANYSSGNITCAAVTSCGASSLVYSILVKAYKPALPQLLSGPSGNICSYVGRPVSYVVGAVSGAISYAWTVPANVSILSGQGTDSITVLFDNAFTTGAIVVHAVANCGNSTDRSISVNKINLPTPSIYGASDVCSLLDPIVTTYSTDSIAGAASYSWTVPAGATLISGQGTPTIHVKFSTAFVTGNITLQTVSNCGTSNIKTFPVSKKVPSTPGAISGPVDVCTLIGTNVTYTIPHALYASSYHWSVPANVTVVSDNNDTTITVQFSSAYSTGVFSVTANSGCGTSAIRNLTVNKKLAATPGTITGPADACPYVTNGTDATYSIKKVNLATGYTWAVSSSYAHITGHAGSGINDTAITVHFDAAYTSGTVSVKSNRDCGSSTARSLTVIRKIPASPTTITGNMSPCPNATEVYTTPAVANATYIWAVPPTATFTGQGTNSITVTYKSTFISGNISVKLSTVCGTSAGRTLNVTKNAGCRISNPVAERQQSQAEMTIYPNPSNGHFFIEINYMGGVAQDGQVVITNTYGQVMMSKLVQHNHPVIEVTESSKLTKGIYMVTCTIGNNSFSKKLIIQ